MAFDPDQYLAIKSQQTRLPLEVEPELPDVSLAESALRGGAQGLTLGFADEIAGGLESAIDPNKTYEQARDESRQAYKMAEQANPGTYLTGDIAGSILPALIPGAAGVSIGKATLGLAGRGAASGVARMAGQAALAGAVEGLGRSEGERVSDIAKDVAMGGITGGVVGGALGGLGRAAKKGADLLPSTSKLKQGLENRVAGMVTGLSDEGVDVLRKNPNALKQVEALGAGTVDDVATKISSQIQDFAERNPVAQRLNQNYDRAMGLLDSSSAVVDLTPVQDSIQKRLAKLDVGGGKAFGEQSQATQAYLQSFGQKLNEAFPDGVIDAPNAKRVINQIRQDIQKYGGFTNPNANSEIGSALKDIQRELDGQLKTVVPGFKDVMKEVQKDTILNERLTKQFVSKNYGVDENKVKSFIKNQIGSSPNPKQTKLLKQLSEQMGGGLDQSIESLKLKKLLEGRSNQGSNLVNAGAGAGAVIDTMLGLPFGVATGAGALAGKRLETTGRKLTSDYFARQANKQPYILSKVGGTKYADVLQDAAQRGSRNFAVAHYLLSQQDENYRNMMDEENDNQE